MRSIFFLVLVISACRSASQNNNHPSPVGPVNKKIDTIHSKILNEDRFIWIRVPETARKSAAKKYPVVFLFDGEALFDDVTNILSRISKENGNNTANEMIIVGIGNIWQRYRDYSPTHIQSSPWVDDITAKTTGGGDIFISFIEKELLPHINATYPASSSRILIGHSMGGLELMNILLKYSDLFDYYAAIDPGMWWDDQQLLKESKTLLNSKTFENKTLFLAVANTMEKNMDIAQIRRDTSDKTVLIRPSLLLADYMNTNKQNKLKFEWKFYKDYHHMTVPSPAMYDALKFFIRSL